MKSMRDILARLKKRDKVIIASSFSEAYDFRSTDVLLKNIFLPEGKKSGVMYFDKDTKQVVISDDNGNTDELVPKALFPNEGDLIVGTGEPSTPITLKKGKEGQLLVSTIKSIEWQDPEIIPVIEADTYRIGIVVTSDYKEQTDIYGSATGIAVRTDMYYEIQGYYQDPTENPKPDWLTFEPTDSGTGGFSYARLDPKGKYIFGEMFIRGLGNGPTLELGMLRPQGVGLGPKSGTVSPYIGSAYQFSGCMNAPKGSHCTMVGAPLTHISIYTTTDVPTYQYIDCPTQGLTNPAFSSYVLSLKKAPTVGGSTDRLGGYITITKVG